jgi:hypothetical protein
VKESKPEDAKAAEEDESGDSTGSKADEVNRAKTL